MHGTDEPGTPSSKLTAAAPSPLHRRAEEVAELRAEVAKLRRDREDLQASTEQLRLHSNVPAGTQGRSTSDSISRARQGTEGFRMLHVLMVVLIALLLGVLSRVDSRHVMEVVAVVQSKAFSAVGGKN